MTRGYDPAKAKYSQSGDVDTKLLEQLIPQYDRRLLSRMIYECKAVIEDAQGLGLRSNSRGIRAKIVPLTIRGAYGETSHYTIDFTSPLIRYVPPEFISLHRTSWYTRTKSVEYLPCYIMNLNRVVLAKFYLSDSANAYTRIGNGLFHKLDFTKGKSMILSSDNIFLPGSMEERTQDFGQEIIKKYFEYGWWHLPTPSDIDDISCMHSLIYHTSSRIKDIIQLRKTLLRVIKFYRPGTREIIYGSKTTKGVYADAALLVDDGKKIFSEKRGVFITEGVFHRIKEGYLVNAIIATRSKPPMVPMVIGNAGQDMGRVDIRSVFAVVMWTILRHKKTDASLTLVGDIDEITSNVSHVLENNAHEYDAFYPDFAWRFVRSDAKKALSATFPLYVRVGSTVYHLPSALASFLLTSTSSMLSDVKVAKAIVKIFDLVSADTREWGSNAHSVLETRMAQGTASPELDRLLSRTPLIAAEIALSRIFSRYAGMWKACM